MKKLVINKCYGGFSLSEEAIGRYRELSHCQKDLWRGMDIPRDDPFLVQVVDELGSKADGDCAELKVIEIPSDVEWELCDYDGVEWVAERHRRWD